MLLRYSAHLSLDVHCSSHLKKKKFLLTSLSSLIKKTISYSLSLSPASSSFFFLPQKIFFFSLAHRPAPLSPSSLSSPANSLIADLFRQPSSLTHPKLPHRRSVQLAGQLPLLSSLSQRLRPKPPLASTSPTSTSPTQVSSHEISRRFVIEFLFFIFFYMGLVAIVMVVDFGCGGSGWFWLWQ